MFQIGFIRTNIFSSSFSHIFLYQHQHPSRVLLELLPLSQAVVNNSFTTAIAIVTEMCFVVGNIDFLLGLEYKKRHKKFGDWLELLSSRMVEIM